MTMTTNKQSKPVSFLMQLGHGYEPHKLLAKDARDFSGDSEAHVIAYARWDLKKKFSITTRLPVAACREIDAITKTAHARAQNRPVVRVTVERVGAEEKSVQRRSVDRLARAYRAEIRARGGEIAIEERDGETRIRLVDKRDGLCLLHADGWRAYSKRESHRASLSYLCGADDSGRWAVRVPGTIERVSSAVEWVEPAEVRIAKKRGLTVLRQGDVYAVQTTRKSLDGTGDRLPSNHAWDAEARVLTHTEHAPLSVPFFCRFYMQKAYVMGRSGRMGSAD